MTGDVGPRAGRPLILFDLDDTLVATAPGYERVIAALCERIGEEFGSPAEEVREAQSSLDGDFASAHVFDPDRFPNSFAATYRRFCSAAGRRPEPEREESYRRLGRAVYDDRPPLRPGAREAIEALAGRAELRIYTLGSEAIQGPKIRAHALEDSFDAIHIVPRKDVGTLARIVDGRDPRRVALVGDSLRFEINPALELGLFAVHVAGTGEWKLAQEPPRSDEYRAAEDLHEARRILEEEFLGAGTRDKEEGEDHAG